MSSLKEEDAKWKINIKHEPGTLNIKSDVKIKKEPGCPVHTKSDVKAKKEHGCPVHTKSDVKIKKEPGCENENTMNHDPGYTPAHDLSVVHDPGYTPAHDLSVVHDPGYTPAHDLSVVHDPGYTPAHDLSDDGDGDIDDPEKIIQTEPDVSDGKTEEKCKSKEKRTGE